MRVYGFEAVSMYGVCTCERATLLNQIWIEVKFERILQDGTLDITMRVLCGFCGRSVGATE